MRVIIAGGGTGGHLYPGIAIAEKLLERGAEILFIVSDRGIERKILSGKGYDFIEQNVTAFKGKGLVDKMLSISAIFRELLKLRKKIKSEDKVIILGGFASFAPGIVAVMKGCEIYIHEQNSVMGVTNRFFSRYARRIFLSFENTLKSYGKTVLTGNPIRKEITAISPKEVFEKNILVVGGSQGSRFINKIVVEIARTLISRGYKIFHQTGEKIFDETVKMYNSENLNHNPNVEIFAYTNEIQKYYAISDIVISRAGAGSVFEIMGAKRPAIYIPLKIAADNHQYYNALHPRDQGIAIVIEEGNVNKNTLLDAIEKISENYEAVYLPKLEKIELKDSAQIIADEMRL